MTTIQSFEDFEVWKRSREIVNKVYLLTRSKAFAADFALKEQIRRAAVSILSNIAEGYESQTENVFLRHLGIAKGSCGEVRSQLYVALDQQYICESEFKELTELCRVTACQLFSLIQHLKRSNRL